MTDYAALPSGLIVPRAEAGGPGRPTLTELAPQTGGRDITRGLVDALPLLPPQDRLSERAASPFYLDLYLDILDDWQVASTLQQRRLALTATEWQVLPGGTARKDKQAAGLIDAILKALRWDQITAGMHYGVFFGHAAAEILWATDGAQVVPQDIRVRDPRRFAYRPDGTQVLLTTADPAKGEPLPPRKFWTFRVGSWHDDDPYGMGIAHWCYWPVLFKRGSIKLWLIALDKFASPTALGHFPPSATEAERNRLLYALEAIRSQSALILPEGMTAELLAAARSGTADYHDANLYWDAAISKVIAGHSAAADATPGRLGGEDTAREVREDLVRADADLLCASANLSWVRWCVDWNYPGAAYPVIWRRTEEDEDLNQRAERDAQIFSLGYRPTLQQVQDTYGGEWEAVAAGGNGLGGDLAGDPAGQPPPQPSAPGDRGSGLSRDFAGAPSGLKPLLPGTPGDPSAQELIDAEAGADPGWATLMDALLAPIFQALEQGLTPEEILAQMDEWYPQMDGSQLEDLLTRGLVAAETLGRLEAAAGR